MVRLELARGTRSLGDTAGPAPRGAGAALLARPVRGGDRVAGGDQPGHREGKRRPGTRRAGPHARGVIMARTEERLAPALGATALALREDTLRPLQVPERGRHRLAWVVPVAAAAS